MRSRAIPCFIKGMGLGYQDQNDNCFIWEFCPEVVSVTAYYRCRSGKIQHTVYAVRLLDKDGTDLGVKELGRIDKIPYYDIWGVPDADLTARDHRLILKKFQQELAVLEKKEGFLAEAGFHNSPRMFVLGDKIISSEEIDVVVQDPIRLKDTAHWDKLSNAEINREIVKIMEIWTEVTVPLFYVAIMQVIRYLLPADRPRMAVAVVGPSGHLKTTLVSMMCLILDDIGQQKCTIRGHMRTAEICGRIDRLEGLYFLVDDVHPTATYQSQCQQEDRLDTIVRHISTYPNTADVIITAETDERLGRFSAQDRMFVIHLPKLTSEGLGEKKQQLDRLHPEVMTLFIQRLAKALICDWDNALSIAEAFLHSKDKLPFPTDNTTRTPVFMENLIFAEQICSKYMFSGDEGLSHKEALISSLDTNYQLHLKKLTELRDEAYKIDYILELYEILDEESRKVKEGKGSMVYANESSYRTAPVPKILYVNRLANSVYLITRDNLQLMLMNRLKHTIPINDVVKTLKNAGILQTYSDSGSTKKWFGQRHLTISSQSIYLYTLEKKRERGSQAAFVR